VKITFDPAKRAATLAARGVDFVDAAAVFASRNSTRRDLRFDYGEDRFITIELNGNRLVVVVWTPRSDSRRMISMRDANAKEKRFFDRYVR
jgi:uncharacterized DUF497 family protein